MSRTFVRANRNIGEIFAILYFILRLTASLAWKRKRNMKYKSAKKSGVFYFSKYNN